MTRLFVKRFSRKFHSFLVKSVKTTPIFRDSKFIHDFSALIGYNLTIIHTFGGIFHVKKLHDAMERFTRTHPRFGIPGLMRYIVFGTAFVYLLLQFSSYSAISFLAIDWGQILRGEVWRLVTFIFIPTDTSPLWLLLTLYFSYSIGNLLEREWGTAKFSLYYFSGVLLTVLTGIISYYAFGYSAMYGSGYVSMAMFLAFAALYPEMQVILLFIPLKVKWLAAFYGIRLLLQILFSLLRLDLVNALLPVVALLNFLVFFWTNLHDAVSYRTGRARHQTSRQTIQFKSAVRRQKEREAERGYRHKCAVCGRTDADSPDLEFRYCSRCAGYHCFCSDHIFSHEHFTQ